MIAGRTAMNESAVEWLRQEAVDELAEFDVGVYGLLWELRASKYHVGEREDKDLVRHVVRQLLSAGEARLIHLKWASDDKTGDGAPESELEDDLAFEFASDGTYLALSGVDSK